MVRLALDTSLEGCSAALFDGDRVVAARFEVMERGHAERLPVLVDELFREAGVLPSALTAVAVTRGPGTFTGVRIGLSYAVGLGIARGIPVTGIDTLTATAMPHRGAAPHILVAHRAGATGKLYAALFNGADLSILVPPALLSPSEVAAFAVSGSLAVGTGADAVVAETSGLLRAMLHHLPDAALFGLSAFSNPYTDHPATPLYLREADAKPSAAPALALPQLTQASVHDAAVLAELHQASFTPGWTAEMLQSSLSLPGAGALLATLAGRPHGFVQFQWIAGEAEVNTLCVLSTSRRQGFGRLLMEALISDLKKRKTQKLFLEVAADNAAALRLYRSLGFQETGLRRGYYAREGAAVDAITMTLAL